MEVVMLTVKLWCVDGLLGRRVMQHKTGKLHNHFRHFHVDLCLHDQTSDLIEKQRVVVMRPSQAI